MVPALAAAVCGSCGAAVTLATCTAPLDGSSSSSSRSSSGCVSTATSRCRVLNNARLQISSHDVGRMRSRSGFAATAAKSGDDNEGEAETDEKKNSNGGEAKEKGDKGDRGDKASPLTSITDALDFALSRSEKDANLIATAREATKSGEKMSREQYGALKRKIGGTYKDFFKDSVEVIGDYVDAGWVDKTCRFCKQDTSKEPRTKDSKGRYAHVTCLEKEKQKPPSGNFFSKLFGKG